MNKFAFLAALLTSASYAAIDQQPFPFDRALLAGWWAESVNTSPACAPSNLKTIYDISQDGKKLEIRFDRTWKTELGERERITATILSASDRTLVIRYDDESRMKPSGSPVEWELSVVAPGVYRWRETSWKPGAVNIVVGIRCSQ